MELGVLYFSAHHQTSDSLLRLVDQVRRIDELGLAFVSFPERHFDRFGGSFANPLLYCAVAATHTKRIAVRTGSLIPALHNSTRLKEDMRIVDQLSSGRLQLSLGSGWNPDDFCISPERFADRRAWLSGFVENFDAWYGSDEEELVNGVGQRRTLRIHPTTFSRKLALWMTISSNAEAWNYAGRIGLNVLSHMENVDHEGLVQRVQAYREGRVTAGLSESGGRVTLLQHTAISDDADALVSATSDLASYLSQALLLERAAVETQATMSGNKAIELEQINNVHVIGDIFELAVRRYRQGASLICDFPTAIQRVRALEEIGVDEVACLFDFVQDHAIEDATLERLGDLQALLRDDGRNRSEQVVSFCS